jgi:hypothetical protein
MRVTGKTGTERQSEDFDLIPTVCVLVCVSVFYGVFVRRFCFFSGREFHAQIWSLGSHCFWILPALPPPPPHFVLNDQELIGCKPEELGSSNRQVNNCKENNKRTERELGVLGGEQ